MTAMELFREDRKNRKEPDKLLPRQEYFALLRDTLHGELTRDGRSELLDEMLSAAEAGKALPMLEFAALRECSEMIVEGREMLDASSYVPHIRLGGGERLPWSALKPGESFRVENPEAPAILKRLRSMCRQMVSLRDQTLGPEINRAAQREIDGLKTLYKALERDNMALRQEREELKERIAALESGYVSDQVQHRIAMKMREAESELAQDMSRRRREGEEAIRQAWTEAAQRCTLPRDEAAMEDRAAQYVRLKSDMRREMAQLQSEMDERLGRWQQDQKAEDYRFLARSFAGLCGAVEAECARLMAGMYAAGPELTAQAAQLAAVLDGRIRQMEQAMAQLGLRLIRPEAGEPFDPALHTPARTGMDDVSPEEAVIDRTETPGVKMTEDEAGSGVVLVQAVVHLKRGGESWQA